jgi:hypothetical protein
MFSSNGDWRKYAFPYKIGYGVVKFIKFFKKRGVGENWVNLVPLMSITKIVVDRRKIKNQ